MEISPKDAEVDALRRESGHDYRYFPGPNLLPVHVSDAWREDVRAFLPELPPPSRLASFPRYRSHSV